MSGQHHFNQHKKDEVSKNEGCCNPFDYYFYDFLNSDTFAKAASWKIGFLISSNNSRDSWIGLHFRGRI